MCRILTENLTETRLSIFKAGYQLNELLIQCKINRKDCETNFKTFFHPNYGNCYTFNPTNVTEIFSNRIRTNSLTFDGENIGVNGKLFLELFSCQNEFIHDIEARAGFRIFIHRKHEIPILSENSLLLPPKTFTQLIYSQRIIRFFQQCHTDLSDDMKRIFNSNSVRYSQALCLKLCEFRSIEDKCNCTDQFFLVFTRFFSVNRTIPINTKQPCSIGNRCSARIRFSKLNKKQNQKENSSHTPSSLQNRKNLALNVYPNVNLFSIQFSRPMLIIRTCAPQRKFPVELKIISNRL